MAREDGRPKNPDTRGSLLRRQPSLSAADKALLAAARSPYPGEIIPNTTSQHSTAEIIPIQIQPEQGRTPSSVLHVPDNEIPKRPYLRRPLSHQSARPLSAVDEALLAAARSPYPGETTTPQDSTNHESLL